MFIKQTGCVQNLRYTYKKITIPYKVANKMYNMQKLFLLLRLLSTFGHRPVRTRSRRGPDSTPRGPVRWDGPDLGSLVKDLGQTQTGPGRAFNRFSQDIRRHPENMHSARKHRKFLSQFGRRKLRLCQTNHWRTNFCFDNQVIGYAKIMSNSPKYCGAVSERLQPSHLLYSCTAARMIRGSFC